MGLLDGDLNVQPLSSLIVGLTDIDTDENSTSGATSDLEIHVSDLFYMRGIEGKNNRNIKVIGMESIMAPHGSINVAIKSLKEKLASKNFKFYAGIKLGSETIEIRGSEHTSINQLNQEFSLEIIDGKYQGYNVQYNLNVM